MTETDVLSVEPTFSQPPAYSGGNARRQLDDVPDGGEVALREVDIRVRTTRGSGRDRTTRDFEVSYRVDYDARAVVARTITEVRGATSSSDATLATVPLAAAVARADRAARSFLDRDGLDFELRSVGGLIDAASDETADVLVSDVETVVDAQDRADAQKQTPADD